MLSLEISHNLRNWCACLTHTMKILFDHPNPFLLAHGGFQTQIEQTKAGLIAVGVEVEYLRWWDDHQTGDVIHYFGRPMASHVELAKKKGLKFVLGELLTGLGSRSGTTRAAQRLVIRAAQSLLPTEFTARMGWNCYRLADACIANTPWERKLMIEMFGALAEKVHCLPNGVETPFFAVAPHERGSWLVCTATITERKRVVELAEAAVLAQTPLWVVGRPYSESDPYGCRFLDLARQHPKLIRYEGAVGDRAKLAVIYREARGFVLLSTMESLSLSALEAAACECPLLLSDLPWARCSFSQGVEFCPVTSPAATARILRRFYDTAPKMSAPLRPLTWPQVGDQLAGIYRSLFSNSR